MSTPSDVRTQIQAFLSKTGTSDPSLNRTLEIIARKRSFWVSVDHPTDADRLVHDAFAVGIWVDDEDDVCELWLAPDEPKRFRVHTSTAAEVIARREAKRQAEEDALKQEWQAAQDAIEQEWAETTRQREEAERQRRAAMADPRLSGKAPAPTPAPPSWWEVLLGVRRVSR